MPPGTGKLVADAGSHVLQLYATDQQRVSGASSYIADGLQAGASLIVAATAPHRARFAADLAAAGIDVAAARAAGRLVDLDAARTMDRFLTSDWPGPGGFESEVGGLVEHASTAGPVRIYGEMVTLLWQAGHVDAAIELEALWTGLARRLPFTLLCAYPAQANRGDHLADALDEVRRMHSSVTGVSRPSPAGATRSFMNGHNVPRAARQFVAETMRPWTDPSFISYAVLVVSELVSNVVIHARTGCTVAVARSAGAVRISVRDASPMPCEGDDSRMVPHRGHGLGLVAVIAREWAVQPLPDGKIVWAELAPWGS
jgi:hypothetical protein